ncbi:MAG: GumC family protein [Bacillota bacterium]
MAREAVEDEIDLRRYLALLWRRRWLIAGVTAMSALAAVLLTRAATPLYEATTTVLIRPGSSSMAVQENAAAALLLGSKSSLQNYVELLKSRTVIERVVLRLEGPGGVTPERVERLRSAVTVQPVPNTDTVRISVRLPDPGEAEQVANAIVESFAAFSREMNRLEARSALAFIESQLQQVQEKLRSAENALLSYKEAHRLVEPSEQARAAVGKLADLEKMRAGSLIAMQETGTRIAQVRSQLDKQLPTLVTSTTIASNPLVQSYKLRLSDVEARISAARQTLSANHPQMVALEAEAAELRRLMSQEVERVVSAQTESLNPIYQGLVQELIGLEVDQLAQQARQEAITRLVSAEEAALLALPARELELARLSREQRVNEEIYVMLRTRYEELRLQEASVTADVRIIDPAVRPTSPVAPRPLLNLAVALFLGMFVGVGATFVLEFIDTSVKSEEEIEHLAGAPVLGRIPEFLPEPGDARRGEGGRP